MWHGINLPSQHTLIGTYCGATIGNGGRRAPHDAAKRRVSFTGAPLLPGAADRHPNILMRFVRQPDLHAVNV